MPGIKRSQLAGTWYPADARELRRQIDGWVDEARQAQATVERPCAVIVPHAGYQYSGRAAAAAYACVGRTAYARVVILAPSHRALFRGAALIDAAAFATPLGTVPVDEPAVAALYQGAWAAIRPDVYRDEHSLEMQLPFLQCVCPGAPVVPVLLGSLEPGDATALAHALGALADRDTLFVVSSDFVHYGRRFAYEPFPATGAAAVAAALREVDMGAIRLVCAGDAAGFEAYVERTGATICGRVPITVFLTLHGRRTPGTLLAYYTSLDVTGEYEHSVSYASVGFPPRCSPLPRSV